MNFLDYIKQGDAVNATVLIETVLKQKTLAHIKEQRSVVAEITYNLAKQEDIVEAAHPWSGELTKRGYKKIGTRHTNEKNLGSVTNHDYSHPNGYKITLRKHNQGTGHGFHIQRANDEKSTIFGGDLGSLKSNLHLIHKEE
jgi:hypothetical protein